MVIKCLSLFLLMLTCPNIVADMEVENEWLNIEMPKKSWFMGFDPPTDVVGWEQAINNARKGKLLLLQKVMQQIIYPGEVVNGDTTFASVQRLADILVSDKTSLESQMGQYINFSRAPIAMFGYKDFQDNDRLEGKTIGWNPIGANNLLKLIKENNSTINKKIVGIGAMDENWGYLSSHILNRTCLWGVGFSSDPRKEPNISILDQLRPLLDNPNLVMLLVNQHHNVSHPKVISLPRGMRLRPAKLLWDQAGITLKDGSRKHNLMASVASTYRHRPAITACVKQNMGKQLLNIENDGTQKLKQPDYFKLLIRSYAVLALPGLGYDCFRIWEALLSGSMPVLERGTGLDRTLYRLPALLLDDFADATPDVIRQAYVEALYRIDEWDYTRITEVYWQNIVYTASKTGDHLDMLKLHPMKAEDVTFTRPLIPYDCHAMGGCGEGTKRVPQKSCGIDLNTDFKKYDWLWYETWDNAEKARKAAEALLHQKKISLSEYHPSLISTNYSDFPAISVNAFDDDDNRTNSFPTKLLKPRYNKQRKRRKKIAAMQLANP